MALDSGKHHRRSVRLKNYDYSQVGAYFVTITVHQRISLFGEITNGKISLNAYGKIVQSCWEQIPNHFKLVESIAYVVMPNHIHGIIIITDRIGAQHSGVGNIVRARHAVPLRNKFETFAQPVTGSLPTIIRSFKSAVTKRINLLRDTPAATVWQRNYYEHVIRSYAELNRIKEYINNNPAKWAFDKENPDNSGQSDHQTTAK